MRNVSLLQRPRPDEKASIPIANPKIKDTIQWEFSGSGFQLPFYGFGRISNQVIAILQKSRRDVDAPAPRQEFCRLHRGKASVPSPIQAPSSQTSP
jgi:hypothetical protein